MSAPAVTHLRVRYFRPSWQGGDTAQPLCHVPLVGWVGPQARLGGVILTDDLAKVECPQCLSDQARGGVAARKARLAARYIGREGEAA